MTAKILKSLPVTYQKGVAHSDGELIVTETEFHFAPYNMTIGLGPYQFPRNTIASVKATTAKGGGPLPLSQEAIKITLKDHQEYEFIVADPRQQSDMLMH